MKLAIAGAAGRMGQAILRAALDDGAAVAGGSERAASPAVGQDLGVLAGRPAIGVVASDSAAKAAASATCWIDFTTPEATLAALLALPALPAIIGTTGFSPAQEAAIAAAARTRPIVKSGNFSLGVNVLAGLVRQAAARLGADWDIEIIEAHHRRKVDAPSGTALLLGEAAAAGRKVALKDVRLAPREGVGPPRPTGGIGFAAVRGGGIVGEHEVLFATETETLRLSHQAFDRALFAKGALAAAKWAEGQPPGLYSMRDVLGL
jgi:4-hydroxy-tetrahydrodipicolinate reductase